MNKTLLTLSALSLLAIGTSAFANPNSAAQTAMRQVEGWAMANCGSPNPAHCNSGGGSGNANGYSDAPVVAAIWAYDNAKASNMPLFYKVYALKGHAYVGESLADYGARHCQQTYGGKCKGASYAYGYQYYVAVAATHDKGVDEGISSVQFDETRSKAKKAALNACQQETISDGKNPKDCKVIFHKKLDSVKSEVPSKTLANAL